MEQTRYEDLSDDDRTLVDAAREAARTAYAPYSGFSVGAALRTASGEIMAASNVENAAYGETICAERMAVGRANALGHRSFPAVAITASGRGAEPEAPVAPCGACRQVLMELARATGTETRVIMTAPRGGAVTVATLDELLPLAFSVRPGA